MGKNSNASNIYQICSNRSEPCSIKLLLMTLVQICRCDPRNGDLRSNNDVMRSMYVFAYRHRDGVPELSEHMFSTIIATALIPLKMWIPKFYKWLRRQARMEPKSRPFPEATKVPAIVAEKCYQKACKLTNNQTGMARTIFMLFVGQNLIKMGVVSLQLAILTKISRKAAHAFR